MLLDTAQVIHKLDIGCLVTFMASSVIFPWCNLTVAFIWCSKVLIFTTLIQNLLSLDVFPTPEPRMYITRCIYLLNDLNLEALKAKHNYTLYKL